MLTLFRSLSVLCLFAILAGCTEPPPPPSLPGHAARTTERLLLDDAIDPSDIRQIFAALNEDGRLQSIAPWIDGTSDEKLATLGRIITRYIYQAAHNSDGAVGLLSQRIQSRSFSKGLALSREWQNRSSAHALGKLATQAMKSPLWVEVVERDVGFLSPELDESLADLEAEMQRAFGCEEGCAAPDPIPASQVVADFSRFLVDENFKKRWVGLCSSLTESWPIVGFLHGMREVNRRHEGKAFDGMGAGLARMIREPRDAKKGPAPSQFDSLMDLMLALSGPSNGLFEVVHETLSNDSDLVRELGAILQPNLPNRVLSYVPIIPSTHLGLLKGQLDGKNGFVRNDWLALAEDPKLAPTQEAFSKFFISARTAHEAIIGSARDPLAEDYLLFNLPLYLNSFVLTQWMSQTVRHNQATLAAVPTAHFGQSIWDTLVEVPAFETDFTEVDGAGELAFAADKMKALTDFGFSDFVTSLTRNRPPGLGGFRYAVPAMTQVPLKQALRTAVEALDQTRGYADPSSLLRSAIAYLIRPGANGRSFLQAMETPDLMLSVHRSLSSMTVESWQTLRSVVFDGVGLESLPKETKDMMLGLYENYPVLAERFSRILDSMGTLRELDGPSQSGISPFQAYHELVRETGPQEWKALGQAWAFVGESGLFALDSSPDGKAVPRFPSAHSWLAQGDASGFLRLAAQVQPARHRPLADFFNEVLKERSGRRGSETHWEFVKELVSEAPDGVAALWETQRSENAGSRDAFSPDERAWVVRFVREGAFRSFWESFGDRFASEQSADWVPPLRKLVQDGSLRTSFRLLSLVKNDRVKEIARVLQKWESSGELLAFLETLETVWTTRQSAPRG